MLACLLAVFVRVVDAGVRDARCLGTTVRTYSTLPYLRATSARNSENKSEFIVSFSVSLLRGARAMDSPLLRARVCAISVRNDMS